MQEDARLDIHASGFWEAQRSYQPFLLMDDIHP